MKIENNKQTANRPKFIDAVDQITFSGAVGAQSRRTILYVTERCVFRLSEKGLMLVEIAPGVNLQKDILEKMKFTPHDGRKTPDDGCPDFSSGGHGP